MVKVLIVLYGLVMFVPTGETDGSSTGLTAIFVDGGSHVVGDHQPHMHWLGPDGTLQAVTLDAAGDFSLEIESPKGGKIDLSARDGFARLRPLFTHADRGYVERGCLPPDGACEKEEEDLTHGVAAIDGLWQTREATYCDGFKLPIGDYDDEAFEFRRSLGGSRSDQGSEGLGTALVLEVELERASQIDDLTVQLNGEPVGVVKIEDPDVCRGWVGEGVAACAVLLMGNPPHGHGECKGKACRLDKHFSAFYRLTRDPPGRPNRWLPYLLGAEACPRPVVRTVPSKQHGTDAASRPKTASARPAKAALPKLVTKPAVRCPPTFGTVEPESGPVE